MENDFTDVVKLIYGLEPKDEVENEAYEAMFTPLIFGPVIIFKKHGRSEKEACEFMQKSFDIMNAINLMDGL